MHKKNILLYTLCFLASINTKTSDNSSGFHLKERTQKAKPSAKVKKRKIPFWYQQRGMIAAGLHGSKEEEATELQVAAEARRLLQQKNIPNLKEFIARHYYRNIYLGKDNTYNTNSSLISRLILTFTGDKLVELVTPFFTLHGNAKIDAPISANATALTHAMRYGKIKLAQSLLDLRANPFARVSNGQNAFKTFCQIPNEHLAGHLAREARNRDKVATALEIVNTHKQKPNIQKLIQLLQRKVLPPRPVAELIEEYQKEQKTKKRKPFNEPAILTATATPLNESEKQKEGRMAREKKRRATEAWRQKALAEIKAKYPEKFN